MDVEINGNSDAVKQTVEVSSTVNELLRYARNFGEY